MVQYCCNEQANFSTKTFVVSRHENGLTLDYSKKYFKLQLQKCDLSLYFKAFLEGFHSLIPCDILDMFDEKELELLLHGIREYNVQELKLNHTLVGYKSPRQDFLID